MFRARRDNDEGRRRTWETTTKTGGCYMRRRATTKNGDYFGWRPLFLTGPVGASRGAWTDFRRVTGMESHGASYRLLRTFAPSTRLPKKLMVDWLNWLAGGDKDNGARFRRFGIIWVDTWAGAHVSAFRFFFCLPGDRTVKTAAWVTLKGKKIALSAPACLALGAASLAEKRCFHLEIA